MTIHHGSNQSTPPALGSFSERNPFNSRNGNEPISPNNQQGAHVFQAEELSLQFEKHKDFITFLSSVLLWKRPIFFLGLILSWLTIVGFLSLIWNKFSVLHILCIIMASLISFHFIFRSFKTKNFNFKYPPSDFFGPSTYNDIILYITNLLNVISVFVHKTRIIMKENLLIFTYQSLSVVICVAFFGLFLSDKFLLYFIPIIVISMPGLIYNSVLSRLAVLSHQLFHQISAMRNPNNNQVNNQNNINDQNKYQIMREDEQRNSPQGNGQPFLTQRNVQQPKPQINSNHTMRPSAQQYGGMNNINNMNNNMNNMNNNAYSPQSPYQYSPQNPQNFGKNPAGYDQFRI